MPGFSVFLTSTDVKPSSLVFIYLCVAFVLLFSRGMEDHLAELHGYPSSFLVRREHEQRVLWEVDDQDGTGRINADRLRAVSEHSSVQSRLRALDLARQDAVQVHSVEHCHCPLELKSSPHLSLLIKKIVLLMKTVVLC